MRFVHHFSKVRILYLSLCTSLLGFFYHAKDVVCCIIDSTESQTLFTAQIVIWLELNYPVVEFSVELFFSGICYS